MDGLVVNTAKYLSGQPLLAFNPDPEHIDGILLPFRVKDAPGALRRLLAGQASIRQVSMAEAFLNDGQALLAFNDLFIGIQSHASARYHIRAGDRDEEQSSSGIIVSTGAGATGWLSSLFNMAEGMWTAFGGAPAELPRLSLSWEADRLVFVVREPFASKTSSARLVCGVITPESPLLLESHMPDSGLIFSDGVQNDFLAFNAGARATIRLAEKKTCLVVQK